MSTHTIALEANMHLLKQAGISITLPRLELLRVLQEAGRAMTAHQIYRHHIDASHDVPLSTIYVNLKRLEEAGIIQRIRLDSENKNLYCVSTESSPVRLVCKQCGQLLWINDPRLEALMEQISQSQGFSLQRYGVTLEASCQHCESVTHTDTAALAPNPLEKQASQRAHSFRHNARH